MTRRMRLLAATALGAVVVALGAVPAGAAGDMSRCADIEFIAAAGSDELNGRNRNDPGDLVGGTLYEYVQVLRSVLPGNPVINAYGLTGYPASGVSTLITSPSSYRDSVRKGQTDMVNAITAFANSPCRDITHLMVAGYSQGAWALHGALASLPAATAAVVDTVVLVGDPVQKPWQEDTASTGLLTYATTPGGLAQIAATAVALRQPRLVTSVGALVGPTYGTTLWPGNAYVPTTLSGTARVIAACIPGDVICSPVQGPGNGIARHTDYGKSGTASNSTLRAAVSRAVENRTFTGRPEVRATSFLLAQGSSSASVEMAVDPARVLGPADATLVSAGWVGDDLPLGARFRASGRTSLTVSSPDGGETGTFTLRVTIEDVTGRSASRDIPVLIVPGVDGPADPGEADPTPPGPTTAPGATSPVGPTTAPGTTASALPTAPTSSAAPMISARGGSAPTTG